MTNDHFLCDRTAGHGIKATGRTPLPGATLAGQPPAHLKHALTTADMRANFPDFNPDDYLAHDGLQIMKDSNKNLTLGSYFRKDGYTIIMGRTTLCQLEVE